ncbi:MAG: hypothetical protein AAF849_07970 [Bacteroidota bacterium]
METFHYPAKLLLFGEYSVIIGGRALAMPFPHFSGRWSKKSPPTDPRITAFFKYLEQQKSLKSTLDVQQMKADVASGIAFESSIPLGYGLGSSGALCAATYKAYATKKSTDFHVLKAQLAEMEAHFHGTSSGTDPLICYLQKTLLLEGDKIELLDDLTLNQRSDLQFFLLDVGFPRPHSDLINWFMAQIKNNDYRRQVEAILLPSVENMISALIQSQPLLLFDFMHEISHFQSRYFQPMIPESIQSLWMQGLSSDWFKLKLCGAGGGGFFLGMTKDFEQLKTITDFRLIAT